MMLTSPTHIHYKSSQYARSVRVRATQLLTAVDHVADHSSDRDGEVDVFEEQQKYGHVDPLTEQQSDIDIPDTESETDSKSETADT